MRPRGLWRSSQSKKEGGQVAVQKPQCTHLRITASDVRIAGSASCSGAKLVCMRLPQETAGLENTSGIERAAYPGLQGRDLWVAGMLRWHGSPYRFGRTHQHRSEEHTSELQSLMRISYAVFCLKKKKHTTEKSRNITLNILHY